jgi:hypothetical protein
MTKRKYYNIIILSSIFWRVVYHLVCQEKERCASLLGGKKKEERRHPMKAGLVMWNVATGMRSDHGDGLILGVGVGLSATGSGGVD